MIDPKLLDEVDAAERENAEAHLKLSSYRRRLLAEIASIPDEKKVDLGPVIELLEELERARRK